MENQTIEKVKRSYKKVNLNEASILTKIVSEKNLQIGQIAKDMDVSFATCKKHLINPELMNGIERKKIASILGMSINEISTLIDS